MLYSTKFSITCIFIQHSVSNFYPRVANVVCYFHSSLLLMDICIISILCYHEECHYEHPFIHLLVLICKNFSEVYLGVELLGHRVHNIHFYEIITNFLFLSALYKGFHWFTCFPTFGIIRFLNFANLVVINLIVVLIWIILITNGIGIFFLYALVICVSSSVKFLFLSFPIGFFGGFFFIVLNVFFIYPETNPLLLYVLQWSFLKDWEKWFVFFLSIMSLRKQFLNLKRTYLLHV